MGRCKLKRDIFLALASLFLAQELGTWEVHCLGRAVNSAHWRRVETVQGFQPVVWPVLNALLAFQLLSDVCKLFKLHEAELFVLLLGSLEGE